jgi:putative FmdB family regulatory protein
MPAYDYQCKSCGIVEEHVHGMNETPEIKCSCGGLMEKTFSPNIGGFILRGGTPASHYKEKRMRLKKSGEMARRQRIRYGENPGPHVKPNIAGHETGTWEKAHEIAREIQPVTGISPETYAPLAEKEGSKKIIVAKS